MTTPFFIHANPSKSFFLEIHVFYFALKVVFSQPKDDDLFHHVGFHFHKFFLVKTNYEIHE